MSTKILYNHEISHIQHHDTGKTVFGFWIYLMSDFILFATLFATYAVLSHSVAGGPTGKDIFNLPFVLVETFSLLFSSLTYGMAILVADYCSDNKKSVNTWLGLTFLLGLGFVCMELYEFWHLVTQNYSLDRSAFLSGFFVLIGTHCVHVISGLIWILVMMFQISYRGLTLANQTRLKCLSLFWHFLDVIWICVFTVVYLVGVL